MNFSFKDGLKTSTNCETALQGKRGAAVQRRSQLCQGAWLGPVGVGAMVLWARSAVRSVLATALRMPKKAAAAPAKKEKSGDGPVLETSKPGDPIPINYLKNGKGASHCNPAAPPSCGPSRQYSAALTLPYLYTAEVGAR